MNNIPIKDSKNELRLVLGKLKGSFFTVGFFSLFINLLALVPALYMLQLYGRVLASRSETTLVMLTLLAVFFFVVMGLLEFIRSRILIRIGARMEAMLNQRLFDAMFRLSVNQPGSSGAQPLRDLTNIRQFMTGAGLFALFDSPWMPIFIALLFFFHPLYGWFSIVAAVVLLIITLLNELTTRKLLSTANANSIKSFNLAAGHLRNAEVVHAMGMQQDLRERWLKGHYAFLNTQNRASDNASIWANLSKTMRVMSQSLMLGLGAYLAIKGEVSPGMMIAGSIIMGRALAPLDLLISSWRGLTEARGGYRRLNELLNNFPADEGHMSLPSPEGNLSVLNVLVAPPGSRQLVLRGISFDLKKGETLGIIGPSAAGKSSLARVILGLWPITGGEVRLDGADIYQWDRFQVGPYIGYLPQDIELFEGSVAANISRFGELDPEKVVAAAKLADVHEIILKLPDGYDTVIGQAGGVLSGGQRQRIGLARAVYGKPCLVVLDEPNSNLDEQGELALTAAIRELKKQGATIILISHRQPIIQVVDKLMVLRDGQMAAFGARDEVLTKLFPAAQAQQKRIPPEKNKIRKTVPVVGVPL